MHVVGIDENGMGPRLGPLIATSTLIHVPDYQRARLRRLGLGAGIQDSKMGAGTGKMAFAESLALAVAEHLGHPVPASADELLSSLGLDAVVILQAGCPSSTKAQCWGAAVPLPTFGGSVEAGRAILKRLARWNVELVEVKSAIACAGSLNRSLHQGTNKLLVDLSLFERLILRARVRADEELLAVCGMVGGIRDYAPRLCHLTGAVGLQADGRKRQRRACDRAYQIPTVGEIRFEISADDRHFPVAFASLVGKYVRELVMLRIFQFYDSKQSGLPKPSGYHDPVTTRFIGETQKLRRQLRVTDACFSRER